MAVSRRNPLGELIDNVEAVNSWSDADLSRKAKAHGLSLSTSRLSQFRQGDFSSVSADQVQALALVLEEPPAKVARAFLVAIGMSYVLPSDVSQGVEAAIRADGRLNAEDRDLLAGVLRLMVKRRRRLPAEGETPSPET